jgi:iron-sulfur cluster repair protein YtfE (RIC family)
MDHVALKQHIADFITKARSLANSSGEDSESLRRELIRLGYQIYGVLDVHFAKEEDIYLELMDQHMTPEQVGEIVHKMHHH